MISEIFYTLFVWPIHFVLEIIFVLFIRIFAAPGMAVIFLSIIVCTLSLPIYLVADRWQQEDRDLKKRMRKKLDSIRQNFKGDEKQMLINAYYRQMGYSPLYFLKSSAGLLLQIPFFIAAYKFLSHTKLLTGISFIFLNDLNSPDALFKLPFSIFGLTALNIMPFIMTVINLLSSLIYSKNLGKRESIQLFGMAIIFLILLYNSPSGLVLYWTFNNIYSLCKNAAKAYLKKPQVVLKIAAVLVALAFLYFIWSGKASVERYRLLFSAFAILLAFGPFIGKSFLKNHSFKIIGSIFDDKNKKETDILFFCSSIILFLLIGCLNPAQVLSASISDFEKPWTFFLRTMLQGFSFLILIPLFVRLLFPQRLRSGLTVIWSMFMLACLVCYFGFQANYGVMDRNFKLDNTDKLLYAFPLWSNFIVPVAVLVFITFFVAKRRKILLVLLQAASAALLVLICINLVTMQKGNYELKKLLGSNDIASGEMPIYFSLSRIEKNVFVVFLDRAQGSAMYDAIEYMPHLKTAFDGFVFYPNTLSFGANTVTGVPAMLGGYNYTPKAINERGDELLVSKVNSAITLMPKLFSEAGYNVTITDPVIANMQSVPDISIFNDLPNVNAKLLSGKLSAMYKKEFITTEETGADVFDFDILFRYGIFRASLPVLRYGIYYKGQWWREAAYNSFGRAIAEFSSLYYLPKICFVESDEPTLNILMNAVTHENGFYNREYFPQEAPLQFSYEELEKYGSRENAEYMYMLLSAMKQIEKWCEYLKSEGIYDSSRIIIVSDHGGSYKSSLSNSGMEAYNPVLLVKDFKSRGNLTINYDFMTHADTPYIAVSNLSIASEKIIADRETNAREMTAYLTASSQPLRHGPYLFNLTGKRELIGKDVLKNDSWKEWEQF